MRTSSKIILGTGFAQFIAYKFQDHLGISDLLNSLRTSSKIILGSQNLPPISCRIPNLMNVNNFLRSSYFPTCWKIWNLSTRRKNHQIWPNVFKTASLSVRWSGEELKVRNIRFSPQRLVRTRNVIQNFIKTIKPAPFCKVKLKMRRFSAFPFDHNPKSSDRSKIPSKVQPGVLGIPEHGNANEMNKNTVQEIFWRHVKNLNCNTKRVLQEINP